MRRRIPYCGRYQASKNSSDCKGCPYFDGDYCEYWDVHSSNDCPYCNGSGYDFEGGQCEYCFGTGERQT